MRNFIIRRVLILIPLLILITIISFVIVQLPPGSYVDQYIRNLERQGYRAGLEEVARLKARYGLDKSLPQQYLIWVSNMLQGDFGRSFIYDRPVRAILRERLPITITISLFALFFEWIIAIPIGIYSAVKQYSIFDYIATFFGFLGLALPNFLFALILMYFVFIYTGHAVLGVFSPEYARAPWSLGRLLDMLTNISIPVIVLATAGTASLIRTLRGTLLDELEKLYVKAARAKGLKESKLIIKYPTRIAINPLVSMIGWLLPAIVGGEIIVAQVLNLSTIGPVFLNAIKSQDMYLAGAIIMILSTLTVIGTMLSDILLAWIDPRIRYDQ